MNNNDKQKLLIEYLVSSPDTFALCKGIVKSTYFDPQFRKTVDFIHKYYDKYSATPNPDQIAAETGVALKTRAITKDQISYCTEEIEYFCRRKAVEHAIISAPELIANDNYGKVETMIRDAISISLHQNLGLSYFDNPAERIEQQMDQPDRTSTLWTEFDNCIAGGLARKEILLLTANSGGGKSIALANIALNWLCQPKSHTDTRLMDVLYLSFELSEEMIAQRFDTMLTGVPSVRWRENANTIVNTLEMTAPSMGRLVIKRMPSGTTPNQIRAYLKEFELTNGYVPDMIVLDYLDLLGSNEHVSADNISEKDKRATEEVRNIIHDYNMFCVTASQQNRGAIGAAELTQAHIAGGMPKINTADWVASIILDNNMKAQGEIAFCFLKTRSSDGVGKTIVLKWINNFLRIGNLDRPQDAKERVMVDRVSESKSSKSTKPQKKPNQALLDVLNSLTHD